MKILIVKLSSIGDVVHTLPCLYALRSAYPFAKIDWLVEDEAGGILLGHPLLNEVLVIKKKGWLKDFKRTYDVAKKIRGLDYDIVIDFQGLFKSGLWVFLSKGKRRIGFDKTRELSYLFLSERLPAYDPEKHAVDRYLDIVEYLDAKRNQVIFPISISDSDRKRVSELLTAHGIQEGEPLVVINPFARWKTKLWDSKKFARLCAEILEKLPCRIIMIGSRSGNEAGEIKALTNGKLVDLRGQTTLRQLAHLMSLSQTVITVDSGPMHIAAAMGVPVVAIFGPTAPWRTGPYGEIHTVVRRNVSCSPCFSRSCKEMTCMEEISVEDVFRAVESQMRKSKGRGEDVNSNRIYSV